MCKRLSCFVSLLRYNLFLSFSLLITLFFYFPSLKFNYVRLDDTYLVLNRIDYLKNPANVFGSFKESVMYWADKDAFYYRPILTVSFVIDGMLFGKNFLGYHLSNIFYHIVSIILVFRLLIKLGAGRKTAGFLSFLFSIHPVLIQAIAWVPGRNDILLLIFVLSSFFYFVDYLWAGNFKDLAFFSFFFFLAVFTKETAVVLLLIFVLYYFLVLENKNRKIFSRMLKLIFLSLLIVFLWCFMARNFGDRRGGYWNLIINLNWLDFLLGEAAPAYLIYLGKLFFPVSLSVFPLVINNSLNVGLGVSFLVLMVYIFVKMPKKRNILLFGILWFFVFLFPALIKVMVGEALIVYEHRLYLPLFGILIFFSRLEFVSKILSRRGVFYSVLLFFLVFYFFINRSHIYKFKDALSFWEAAYSTSSENFVTSVGLSAEYLRLGDFDKAEEVFKNLDRVKPDSEISHLGFASLYYHKGEFDKARLELNKALERNNKSVRARHYLATIEGELGNYDQAEKFYLEAISLDDDNVDILMGLVYLYFRQGRINEAKEVYKRVQELGVRLE